MTRKETKLKVVIYGTRERGVSNVEPKFTWAFLFFFPFDLDVYFSRIQFNATLCDIFHIHVYLSQGNSS